MQGWARFPGSSPVTGSISPSKQEHGRSEIGILQTEIKPGQLQEMGEAEILMRI